MRRKVKDMLKAPEKHMAMVGNRLINCLSYWLPNNNPNRGPTLQPKRNPTLAFKNQMLTQQHQTRETTLLRI
jgi:hypothetical protein